MPVCIGGMHRSGTSMVTRLLHLCGLYLGQEHDLMPPSSDNPEGFWENTKFVEINEEVLNEFGGGWDCPPSILDIWNEEQEILRLKAKAKVTLQEFWEHEPWGWKDPRNSLTLPLWMTLVPDIKLVVCLRNPLEVALSLQRRNGFSYAFGLTLWKTYYQRVLESTSPEDRIFTHYDSYFHDPRAELRRVLDFLNMSVSEEAIDKSIPVASTELRHNRFTIQHLVDADVSPAVLDSYVQMCEEASWIDNGMDHRGSEADDAASDIDQWLREWNGKRGQTPSTEWLEGAAVEAEKTMPEPSMLATRVGRLDRSAMEAELLRREREDLRTALTDRDTTMRDLLSRLEERDAEAEHSAKQLADRDTTIRDLDALIRTLRFRLEERDAAAEQLASQDATIQALRSQLEERNTKAEYSAEQLAGQDATVQALRKQLAEIQSQLERMIQQKREELRPALAALPAEATVIVVSEGDDELLLELDGREGWHFPQTEDGTYATHHLADGTAAIAHLEALRSEGGDYLLFPRSALWWLERYEKLSQHLESRYQAVVRQEDACVVFALREPAISENAGWRTKFEEVVTECRARLERDPTVLDWNTGLELATIFPQHTIFSPPTVEPALPYLDQSIDIVAISSPDHGSVGEARRVAKAAVVTLTSAEPLRTISHKFAKTLNTTQVGAESSFTLVADWQLEEAAVVLPTASIVIPTYNGISLTETCLGALRETLPPTFRGEIIVVDDASTDETQDVLKRWATLDEHLKVLRNPKNAGFVASCNRGASAATGEIIIFLNNDTLPLPGWLSSLLQTFCDYPDAGAVGGKLVYPDGMLQEAGGIIFADGAGANFGRGDYAADAPLYSYVRDVDYCSGALLATRRSLFKELGGFDTRYRPAYYEDTDYCFAAREKGFRVYYQPESAIVHFEGASSGTDLSSGVKRYQVVNQAKFVEKWSHVLKRQRPRPEHYDHRSWYALAIRDELGEGESR